MTKLTLRESEPRTRARPDESDVGDDLTRHRRDTSTRVSICKGQHYPDCSELPLLPWPQPDTNSEVRDGVDL